MDQIYEILLFIKSYHKPVAEFCIPNISKSLEYFSKIKGLEGLRPFIILSCLILLYYACFTVLIVESNQAGFKFQQKVGVGNSVKT